MHDTPIEHGDRISVFRVPSSHRWWVRFIAVVAGLFAAVCAIIFGAGVLLPLLPGNAPVALELIAVFSPIPVAWLFLLAAFNRFTPTRIVLHDDWLSIGGRLFRRHIPYPLVRAIVCERPEGTIGKGMKLHVESASGTRAGIWLAEDDAVHCFDLLRELSPHAAGEDHDGNFYAPVEAATMREGWDAVREQLRRKAKRELRIAAWCGFVATVLIAGIILDYAGMRSSAVVWVNAALCTFGTIGSLYLFRNHAALASLDADELEAFEEEDLFFDDEDDAPTSSMA